MAEVKVNKEQALAKRETPVLGGLFRPAFPFGRFFGGEPFGLLRELNEEMDRAFRGFAPAAKLEPWAPTVDIQQCNDDVVVTAELPGLKKEEVKVELTEDALIIQGERKQEHKEDHEGFHRWERSYGQFYRSIPLPEGAKTDQAKAELTDGVLKVSVPVAETKKKTTRQVPIEQAKETKPAETKPAAA
ncbi:MAG: Hsp20/alpha crystallin family protein [Acidobacteriia bacterium]|nr:Hsp20/alpha crystallin family protein [Terriglobia bacterium]